MNIIKRNGEEKPFESSKIANAIRKANESVEGMERIGEKGIAVVSSQIEEYAAAVGRPLTVEEVQDRVETALMERGHLKLAKNYITYRYEHELARRRNTTDDEVLSLLEGTNEDAIDENANKDPREAAVQRDYMAGLVSEDLCRRFFYPKDVIEAHDEGKIYIHDLDYVAEKIHNCELINLEDMLQNGTVMHGFKIERPKSLLTACTIATQISAAVCSSTFGGQTISLSHLSPFVEVSRQKIRAQLEEDMACLWMPEEKKAEIVERRLRREIKAACQTLIYQWATITCSNGQSPFISVMMCLGEVKEGRDREDLAMLIEEVLRQRIRGVLDESGEYVNPTFPKLLYVVDDYNVSEDSPYFWLTKLAAECTAKRMVPDYISAKVMRELKVDRNGNGQVYPCMGCVLGNEVIAYRFRDNVEVCAFERMWDNLSPYFKVLVQPGRQRDKYMDLDGVQIFDNVNGWTECRRIIRNADCKVLNVKMTNGRSIQCTPDHPFETENRGVVQAKDLTGEDVIRVDKTCDFTEGSVDFDLGLAWLYGFLLCDSSYIGHVTASIALEGEDDIGERIKTIFREKFGLEVREMVQRRERKGNYKDLMLLSDGHEETVKLSSRLISLFGGIKKSDRKIPSEVFSWSREARMSFLAGIVDADGYINSSCSTIPMVQVGSVNKELAIEEMWLAQSLGMRSSVYQNKYKGAGRADTVRYSVMFDATEELVGMLACRKKSDHFEKVARSRDSVGLTDVANPVSVSEMEGTHYTYDVTTESGHFTVSGVYSHNCRAFLTPYVDKDGKPKYYGRFNAGACTVNLPYAALLALETVRHEKDIGLPFNPDPVDVFFEELDKSAELCHRAQLVRLSRLKGTKASVAPILWQHGAISRLGKDETIDRLMYGGYMTISLGYIGLWETVLALTGKTLADPEGEALGVRILERLNSYTARWKSESNIDWSLYGTPAEGTTYACAKAIQRRFGVVKGVSDKLYLTNSYHVDPAFQIDAFEKLTLESRLQRLSPGGCISYVEVPDLTDNLEVVIALIRHIYDHNIYAEVNVRSFDSCRKCGFHGEVKLVRDDGNHLGWECPHCGNRDTSTMNIVRRVCGYLGNVNTGMNQGRLDDIASRVLHLD